MSEIKLKYGLKNGHIISISDIPLEEYGERCSCICPTCKEPLSAKIRMKGNRKKHFAHRNNHSCDTVSAQQTALHMLAKELIVEEKQVTLPGIVVDSDRHLISSKPEHQPRKFQIEDIRLEKKVSDIVPDIVLTIQGKQCLTEIAVTHFVDTEKKVKIQELKIPLFEIDLSNCYHSEMTRDEIRQAVLFDGSNRRWIYNPKEMEAQNEYRKEQKAKQLAAEQERRKIEQRKTAKRKYIEDAQKELRNLFASENYKEKILSHRNDNQVYAALANRSFYKKCNGQIPFFIDIPITGEFIFQCDRRIWQSAVFDNFVYRIAKESNIYVEQINTWIRNNQNEFTSVLKYAYRTDHVFPDNPFRSVSLFKDVIQNYLFYLFKLGFVSGIISENCTIKANNTIIPPNTEFAELLQDILRSVDIYSPQIDDIIRQKIAKKR